MTSANPTPKPTGPVSPPGNLVHSHNARIGMVLFLIYLALYAGFILLSAFDKDLMGRTTLWGINLGINVATSYGFALIIGAFVLALVYMVLCKSEPPAVADLTEGELAEEMQKEEGSA